MTYATAQLVRQTALGFEKSSYLLFYLVFGEILIALQVLRKFILKFPFALLFLPNGEISQLNILPGDVADGKILTLLFSRYYLSPLRGKRHAVTKRGLLLLNKIIAEFISGSSTQAVVSFLIPIRVLAFVGVRKFVVIRAV